MDNISQIMSLQTDSPIRLLSSSNVVYKISDNSVPTFQSNTLKTAIDSFEASPVLNSYLAAYLVLESSPAHFINYKPEKLVITSNSFPISKTMGTPVFNSTNTISLEDEGTSANLCDVVLKVLITIIGCLMIVAMVFGNVLVCVAIKSDRALQQVQNVLLVSLAASDILIGLVVLPLGLIYTITSKWAFGKWLCEIWKACDVLASTASIMNLCIISVDRYLSIRIPLKYGPHRNYRLMYIMITCCWALSLAIGLPPIFGWKTKKEYPNQCLYPTDIPSYVIYSILFSFYVPSTIMLFVYVNIYLLARKHIMKKRTSNNRFLEASPVVKSHQKKYLAAPKQEAGNQSRLLEKDGTPGEALITNGGEKEGNKSNKDALTVKTACDGQEKWKHGKENPQSSKENAAINQFALLAQEKQKVQKEKERRAILVLGVVMVSFLACWLPFFVFYPIISLCGPKCESPTTNLFLQIFTFFGWANSALNPIIYTIFNMEFRQAFHRLLNPFIKYFKCAN